MSWEGTQDQTTANGSHQGQAPRWQQFRAGLQRIVKQG